MKYKFKSFRDGSLSYVPFAIHVYQKIASVTFGVLFVSRIGRFARAKWAGWRGAASEPTVKIAIVAHAYYLDLVPEILACRAVLPGEVPIHLTVPFDRAEEARARFQDVPGLVVHPYENRGRDIGPFVSLLSAGVLDHFDAVLKLHTKRSPHLLDGEIRRKLLLAMLCGERNAAFRALSAFQDPWTGMVGWAACWRTAAPYWMANKAKVQKIAARMGASEKAAQLGFFEGSMFWFRPAAFAALRDLRLSAEEFEPEAGQVDGTMHHAIERCFTIAAWARGFQVRDLRGRLLG